MELIGRDSELQQVTDRLATRRLVTLIGPGGIGKTSLARAAVSRSAGAYGEGSRIVDLTRASSGAAVRESLAGQLGYPSFRALLDAPGDHSVLMLVDNCEHVIDDVADALDQLLDACEMPTVLATSRSALELPYETVVTIGPLETPPPGRVDAPAVRLFVERARDAGATVEVDEVVAELCRRLDGVPLGIELAAARCRSLAPREILDRLVAGLDVLDRPKRRGARRHQSLRAAIGWSYDLLSDAERRFFEELSVFSGPFTASLAHAVRSPEDPRAEADTQDLLDSLVAASMVVAIPAGDVTWYRELDTLRAFARERLDQRGDLLAAEERFVDHIARVVGALAVRSAATWSELPELLTLYDNVTAAVRWCLANDERPSRATLLVAVLWGVVDHAHTEEIGALTEQVLARWPDDQRRARADAVATAATCRTLTGDHHGAIALARSALDSASGSPSAPATLRRAIAYAHRALGDTAGSLEWFAAMADEADRLGLNALAVEAIAATAHVRADLGETDVALDAIDRAHVRAVEAGSRHAGAWVTAIESSILLRVDVERARTAARQALATSRDLGYAAGVATSIRTLALAAILADDPEQAAGHVLDQLDEVMARGATHELRVVFDAASAVLQRSGRHDEAAALAATASTLPVVTITASVGHELFPPPRSDRAALPVRDAIVLTRAALTDLRRTPPALPAEAGARRGVLRREGDAWRVEFAGTTATVRATKGMDDIARLLLARGGEVHCLELVGGGVDEGDTGEVLDAAARRAYEARVRELQADIDEADAHHDRARGERARDELDALVDQLTAALGLGGRARRAGGSAERARSTVTQRLRATIKRLADVHPALARHFDASIRTGVFCSYRPEEPVDWDLGSGQSSMA